MDFTLQSTLKGKILTSLAIRLWGPDLKKFRNVPRYRDHHEFMTECRRNWPSVKLEVLRRSEELPLPAPLKAQLQEYVEAVGRNMINWGEFKRHYHFVSYEPVEFVWTPYGTIDKLKTAIASLCRGAMDRSECYQLGCVFCLDKCISALEKSDIKGCSLISCYHSVSSDTCWLSCLQENLYVFCAVSYTDLRRIFRNVRCTFSIQLMNAICKGNLVAVRYFFQKLSNKEKNEVLMPLATGLMEFVKHFFFSAESTEILCFFLCAMAREQQIEVLKSDPVTALRCFLTWPWQGYFWKVYHMVCSTLSGIQLHSVLMEIINKRRNGDVDHNYQQMFINVWQESSDSLTKYIVAYFERDIALLYWLFKLKDWNSLNFVLEGACNREQILANVVFRLMCSDKFEWLLFEDNKNSVECFTMECLPSKNEFIRFKDKLRELVDLNYSSVIDNCLRLMNPLTKRLLDVKKKIYELIDGIQITKGIINITEEDPMETV